MTADRARQKERASRVMEWADLNGDDLGGALRLDDDDDGPTIEVVNEALLAAGDLCYALDALDEAEKALRFYADVAAVQDTFGYAAVLRVEFGDRAREALTRMGEK